MGTITTFLLLATVLAMVELSASIQCYRCDSPCEVTKAAKQVCASIGINYATRCTTEVPKEKVGTNEAIRKCMIFDKDQHYRSCPTDSECTSCDSDLCNVAPSIGNNAALMGAIVAFFLVNILY